MDTISTLLILLYVVRNSNMNIIICSKDPNVLYKYGLVYTTPSYLMACKLFGGNMCDAYVTNVHSK